MPIEKKEKIWKIMYSFGTIIYCIIPTVVNPLIFEFNTNPNKLVQVVIYAFIIYLILGILLIWFPKKRKKKDKQDSNKGLGIGFILLSIFSLFGIYCYYVFKPEGYATLASDFIIQFITLSLIWILLLAVGVEVKRTEDDFLVYLLALTTMFFVGIIPYFAISTLPPERVV